MIVIVYHTIYLFVSYMYHNNLIKEYDTRLMSYDTFLLDTYTLLIFFSTILLFFCHSDNNGIFLLLCMVNYPLLGPRNAENDFLASIVHAIEGDATFFEDLYTTLEELGGF